VGQQRQTQYESLAKKAGGSELRGMESAHWGREGGGGQVNRRWGWVSGRD